MDQLLQFIINHWVLCVLLLIVLVAIIQVELSSTVGGLTMLASQDIVNLINRENAVVLDLRDKTAYEQGHITGSKHMLPSDIEKNIKKIQKYKTKPIVLTCAQGVQAPKIASKLREAGFEKLFGLKGGIQAWQTDNLPLVR